MFWIGVEGELVRARTVMDCVHALTDSAPTRLLPLGADAIGQERVATSNGLAMKISGVPDSPDRR